MYKGYVPFLTRHAQPYLTKHKNMNIIYMTDVVYVHCSYKSAG